MAGEGAVHQRLLTGDLSPPLFIGECVSHGAGTKHKPLDSGRFKGPPHPLPDKEPSLTNPHPPSLTLAARDRQQLVMWTQPRGTSLLRNSTVMHTCVQAVLVTALLVCKRPLGTMEPRAQCQINDPQWLLRLLWERMQTSREELVGSLPGLV